MKLITKNHNTEPVHTIEVDQDGSEVNILIDGKLVGYFTVLRGKISLELVRGISEDIFNLEGGFIQVRK